MPYDAWTIYSPKVDYSIARYAQTLVPGSALEVDADTTWNTATLTTRGRALSLHSCAATRDAPKFHRLMGGTQQWLREMNLPADKHQAVADFLSEVQFLVGVSSSAELDEAAKRAVLAMARKLNAKIFTGTDFIDP